MSSAALCDWSWTINSTFFLCFGLNSPCYDACTTSITVTLLYLCSPQHMERLSMLAFHPVKMQSCYEKVEQLNLEGLQQRFDVSNPSVFVSRSQILMREVRPCSNFPWYNKEKKNQHVPKQWQGAWKHSLVYNNWTSNLPCLWWSLYLHLLDKKSMTVKLKLNHGLLSQPASIYFSCYCIT